MKTAMLLCALLLSQLAFSTEYKSLDDYNRRFFQVRDDNGKLLEIRDRSMQTGISLYQFLSFLRDALMAGQRNMRSQNLDDVTDMLMDELISNQAQNSREDLNWLRPHIRESLDALMKQDLPKLFSNQNFKEVMGGFEERLKNQWRLFGINLIAKPDAPRYFYKRNVGYQVVKWALDFAAARLSSVPLLNLASAIIVRYEEVVRTRRHYHQNMFLHYLENYKPEELGLTKSEADHIYSSIYESRIDWFNVWASNNAVNTWNSFGADTFFNELRFANRILFLKPELFQEIGKRHNFAFIDATVDGRPVILNLFNKAHLLSDKPAVAHYYDAPNRVRLIRTVAQMVQFGVGFIPVVPQFVKSAVNTYITSLYREQSITEGALIAYFSEQKQETKKLHFFEQSMNPYLMW